MLCSGPGVGMLSTEMLGLRGGSFERPCPRIGVPSAEQDPVLALLSHPTSGWDGAAGWEWVPRDLPSCSPACSVGK